MQKKKEKKNQEGGQYFLTALHNLPLSLLTFTLVALSQVNNFLRPYS